MTSPRLSTALLTLIVIVGAALRLWGLGYGLPHPMTRPDEEFIVSVALRFFSGDFNPHFFEWPSLYFYVVHGVFRAIVGVGRAVGSFADAEAFIHAAAADPTLVHLTLRLMSVSAGLASLVVVYYASRAMLESTTALCATAFLALCYLHIRDSHFGVLDVPLTLLVLLSVHLLYRAAQRPENVRRWAAAGICAGLATSVKYNAAALLVPGLVAWLLALRDAAPGTRLRTLSALLTFSTGFVGAFLAGSPYIVLDFPSFREGLAAQVIRLTEGHGLSVEHVWLRHLTFSLSYGLGLPVLLSAAVGAVLLTLRSPRLAALLLAFPISYFIVIGGGHTAFIRYATPLLPFFCICAGYAVREVLLEAGSTWSIQTRRLVLAGVVMVLALPSVRSAISFNRQLTETDTRLLAADWLAQRVEPDDSLFESGASYARPHYAWPPNRGTRDLLDFDRRRAMFIDAQGREATPDWIVVAESPLRLYTPVPPELRGLIGRHYNLVHSVRATTTPEPETAFDRQDAFFLPFADFSMRSRPGPDLTIYRRAEGER